MNDNILLRKKTVRLFIIWLITYVGCGFLSIFRNVYLQINNSFEKDANLPDTFPWVIFILIAVYFVPVLGVVLHKAKQVQIKWLIIVATVLLIHFAVTLLFALIIIVGMYLS